MSIFDGLTEIKVGADPGSGINPDVGYIFTWIESVGPNYILKYKTSSGVVGSIGTSGSFVQSVNSGLNVVVDNTDPLNPIVNSPITKFPWMLQAGAANLPSTGTESGFSYGNNSANDGVCMMRDGNILAISIYGEPTRTSGTATVFISKNNVQNNVVGQRAVIDGTNNSEGGVDGNRAYYIFDTPFPYSAGDQIEVRVVTSGWNPTSTDVSVLVHMEDTL